VRFVAIIAIIIVTIKPSPSPQQPLPLFLRCHFLAKYAQCCFFAQ
jgi:hypothetical protein